MPPKKRQRAQEELVMLVTGASSGVGAAIVKHYTTKGYLVAALARSEKTLKAICADANKTSGAGSAHAYQCDVSDRDAVLKTVKLVTQQLGPIDVLVNNAAVGHPGKEFWKLSLDDIDGCIDINAKGTMYVTHAVLQGMIKRDAGMVFGIASVAGTWGIPHEAGYVASKHAMVGFLDTLANETRGTGLRVSTICPGGIDTPWWSDGHPYGGDKTHAGGTTSMLIQPQEIIDLMDYQLSLPANRVMKRVVFFPKGEWH